MSLVLRRVQEPILETIFITFFQLLCLILGQRAVVETDRQALLSPLLIWRSQDILVALTNFCHGNPSLYLYCAVSIIFLNVSLKSSLFIFFTPPNFYHSESYYYPMHTRAYFVHSLVTFWLLCCNRSFLPLAFQWETFNAVPRKTRASDLQVQTGSCWCSFAIQSNILLNIL